MTGNADTEHLWICKSSAQYSRVHSLTKMSLHSKGKPAKKYKESGSSLQCEVEMKCLGQFELN